MKKPDYSSFFYFNPLPSWVYDLKTFQILDVNQAAIKHYGYTKEEFIKLSIKDLRPKEEIPNLLSIHATVDKTEGNIFFGVFNHKKKNGELIRMEINGHKVDYLAIESMMVVANDVTEQELQLKHLKESEEKLKAATAIAKLGYWQLALDGSTLSWTDEVYKIWARERSSFDVDFKSFFNTIHPDEQEAFKQEQTASFAGDRDLNFIHRIILPDNSIRWVHELGRLVKNKEGVPVGFEGTVQDVTERRREEQRLKLLESVVTNTNDAILITEAEPIDLPGPRIIYVNEAFTRMTGYTAKEVIGKSPRFLQGPNTDRTELAKLKKAMQNHESCEITTINYKKNREEFWINLSVTPVANEKGHYTHFIAIERDVTEIKYKELEKEFLSKISLAFNFENELINSISKVCQTVSEFGQFDFVEIWNVNMEKSHLQLFAHHVLNAADEIFYEDSSNIKAFQHAEGLQGKVWAVKEQIIWTDIEKHTDFVRKEAAKKIGLQAIMGVPLIFKETVVAVLLLGTKKDVNFLNKNAGIFQHLEKFLGSEMNRKKLENDLSHLYKAIPDLLCVTNFQGKILKINKSGCKLLGYQEEELLFHTFHEFLHPDDINISNIELSNLIDGKSTPKFENRYLTKNGDIVWLSWNSNSSVGEGLIYSTAKNITEEKRLRELNRQANLLAKIGSWEVDMVLGKIYWSDIVHELHETNPQSFVPDLAKGINFYRQDFRAMVQTELEKSMRTAEPFDFEAVLITAKKNERWVRAIGNAEFVDGQCKRIYGSFQDIHASKLMELQIREILGSISDAFYALDKNWNFTFFNKESENLLLKKEAEVIGKNIWKVFPAATGTILEEIYYRVSKTGISESFEYLFPGDGRWYEINVYPSNGGISAYFKIIDERKQAAEQLNKAFEEKNTILESIGDAFFSVNKNWIVTYWNKEAENISGTKRDAIVGAVLWHVYADVLDTGFYRNFHEAMDTQKNITFIEYYLALNKWFEASVYPSASGLSVYFKDVTHKKQADMLLQQANERFEKVTEATNDAIWDWDIANNTFYRSKAIEKFFGAQASKIFSGADFWQDQFHPDYLPNIKESINSAIADPLCTHWEMEYQVYNEKGKIIDVMDRGVILRDSNGQATRMVGAMSNISERKKYETELLALNDSLKKHAHDLERLNEELEQFAFIASHDLQEPLRMITSFLDLLELKYHTLLDEKAHQYIHYATDGAKRMKQIILDLLEYSRAGKLNDSTEEIDLNEVLNQYVILRKKIINEKNVQLKIIPLPVIQSYKAPLTQTVHCLLDNAIKYAKEGQQPIIEVSSQELDGAWVIRVSDNGIGIDPRFFNKIFVIFQRLHNREMYDGNGIGLSIAKRQVESWGGSIWVQSEPGKGSDFYFTHPKNIHLL